MARSPRRIIIVVAVATSMHDDDDDDADDADDVDAIVRVNALASERACVDARDMM